MPGEAESRAEQLVSQAVSDKDRFSDVLSEKIAKINMVRDMLKSYIVGQDDYIDALLTGLMASEHIALISPPGTAKSYAVRLLQQMIDGANLYTALFNPYLSYDQVFGPIDIAELRKGRVVRKWGNIIKAHLAFLDEGFKANPALLNSLLSWLNERVVYDPFTGQQIKVPLITAVIASNEVPTEESLRALWDRIAIRVYGKYLKEPELLREALTARLMRGTRLPGKILGLEDIYVINKLIDRMLDASNPASRYIASLLSDGLTSDIIRVIHSAVVLPLNELRKELEDDVLLSDRTILAKAPRIWLAATLLLSMRHTLSYSMLEALRRLFMYSAGDEDVVESTLNVFNSLFGDIYDTLQQADSAIQRIVQQLTSAQQTYNNALAIGDPKIISGAIETIKKYHELVQKDIETLNYLIESLPDKPPVKLDDIADFKTLLGYMARKEANDVIKYVKYFENMIADLKKRAQMVAT